MRIHTLHGVLAHWDATRLVDRLYVPRGAFIATLERLPKKYVAVQSCGPDDAGLTIDDSTMAGAEACLIARQLGHEVTLFLNPYQIVTQTPYFFTILNLAIDSLAARARRADPTVTWRSPELVELRRQMRLRLMRLSGATLETEIRRMLSAWNVEMPEIPPGHGPLDGPTLSRLVSAGVQIGNHGWAHTDIVSFTEDELWEDISRAQQWLRDATGQAVDLYAVPFGLTRPPDNVLRRRDGLCLLVDSARPEGELERGVVNRSDITDAIAGELQAAPSPMTPRTSRLGQAIRDHRARVGRVLRAGLAKVTGRE